MEKLVCTSGRPEKIYLNYIGQPGKERKLKRVFVSIKSRDFSHNEEKDLHNRIFEKL